VNNLEDEIDAINQKLSSTDPDTQEYRNAQDAGLRLRNEYPAMAFPAQLEAAQCKRVGERPYKLGSTFDVWEGLFLGSSKVAMKLLRDVRVGSIREHHERRFHLQVGIWRNLEDDHILKLHGWCIIGDDLYLVSPWMTNGDICSYLRRRAFQPEEYIALLKDILLGLRYLHSHKFLHGSLQPSNILINKDGRAVLSDFTLANEITTEPQDDRSTTSANRLRYQDPENSGTVASDIYSWAMSALEILSGIPPFKDCKGTIALIRARKTLPLRTQFNCRTFERYPTLWDILVSCWGSVENRPRVSQLLQSLEDMEKPTPKLPVVIA